MDDQKKIVVEKLKAAKNVLVTVSNDPSVDQLAACLGLTLMLNKLGKHAAAVFSGVIPSTIEFLKPEETLEGNTDSLRDFIISLDRAKADKLRYKVEDKIVKIFITPYKTSISQDDLNFSEGDFNVDVVIALGVKGQPDIDRAVTEHGNILHDATVITITTGDEPALGSIHWRDPGASGVSEMSASLAGDLGENTFDKQIATALLTGVVARTERFSNNLTSSQTMTVSAKLMSAGADQQLVATKLEATTAPPDLVPESPTAQINVPPPDLVVEKPPIDKSDPGLLEIDHNSPPPAADNLNAAKVGGSDSSSAGGDKALGLNDRPPSGPALNLPPLDQPLDIKPSSSPSPTSATEGAANTVSADNPPVTLPGELIHSSGSTAPEPMAGGTMDYIETPLKLPNQVSANDFPAATPSPAPSFSQMLSDQPVPEPLPSIHVDENGILTHQPAGVVLKPAPGFESPATPSPSDSGRHFMSQPPAGDESTDGAPPDPPPII